MGSWTLQVYIKVLLGSLSAATASAKTYFFFFCCQKIIITFLANEIRCSVEMPVKLGKHRSPSSWIICIYPNLTDAVFVAGAVQRGTLASEWERTRIMATPASTHLVGPFSRCSDWWRKTPGRTFTGRWAAHLYKPRWEASTTSHPSMEQCKHHAARLI